MIQNEVSLGGSPTINVTLHIGKNFTQGPVAPAAPNINSALEPVPEVFLISISDLDLGLT